MSKTGAACPSAGWGWRGGGIGVVILVVVALFLGVDPRQLMQQMPQQQCGTVGSACAVVASERPAEGLRFRGAGGHRGYLGRSVQGERAHLCGSQAGAVLRRGAIGLRFRASCGRAVLLSTRIKGHIDLSFYRDLRDRFHAPGEFAEAYVIAHEVGHHVQNLLGISDKVRAAQERGSERSGQGALGAPRVAGGLSGRSLGFPRQSFASHSRSRRRGRGTQRGQPDRGRSHADAARGYVSPESFTHGSSEQRVRWFKRGLESGITKSCDTFSVAQF